MRSLGRVVAVASVSLLATGLAPVAARAAERVVWKLGEPDGSSAEFRNAEGLDLKDPKSDPVFVVGTSVPAADWQAYQAGPASGLVGGRAHPFTIKFKLAAAPTGGVARLTFAILYETQRLSSLGVDLNGHAGRIWFQPTLDYGMGDWQGTFVPQTSRATRTIHVPAAYLRAGENTIVLTAIDEPATAENVLGAIAPGHTGLVWDALSMTLDPAGVLPSNPALKVTPTIFYKGTGARETEVVEVRVESSGTWARTGTLTLRTFAKGPKGPKLEVPFDAGELGDARVLFDVPAWKGMIPAAVSVTRGPGTGGMAETIELTAAKKWRVFVVPHEHLDIGFTDYAAKVAELHARSLDEVLEIARATPTFRWVPDGFWVIEQYLAGRSPERARALLAAIRRGTIALPAAVSNLHTGVASLETLIRSLAGSRRFARTHGLRAPRAAHITDVPSYSWSYAQVLADAGIRYLAAGSNGWRAPLWALGRWNERSPFWWEGPDGGRVLTWISRAYLQLHTLFGSPYSLEAVRDALPVFLLAYARPTYTAQSTIIFGSQLENTPLVRAQALLPAAWAKQYAWPKLEFATFETALAAIDDEWVGELPVVRGDFGPYWEDGYGSDARATATHRRNQPRAEAAETLATIPSLFDPSLRPDAGRLARIWDNLMRFDEHTWTYVLATTQPENQQTVEQMALKRAQTTEAAKDIDELWHRGFEQLAPLIGPKDGSILVWNPLAWARSGPVDVDLQDGFELVGADGKPVVTETLYAGTGKPQPGFGGSFRRVRFVAEAVPAVGYALYPLRLAKAKPVPAPARAATPRTTLASPHYTVTLDPASGAIASVVDTELGLELVDPKSPWRFGALVHVSGADDMPRNSLYRAGAAIPEPSLTATTATQGRVVDVRETPWSIVATLEARTAHTPRIRTTVTLWKTHKAIDLRVDVDKPAVITKEAVYVAFPFDARAAAFAYDSQTGWIDPARDTLDGGSREWFATTSWAAVREPRFAAAVIPLDAPLVALGDVVRGRWPLKFTPRSSTILSWVMTNYWNTNFAPSQGGAFSFRYRVTSAKAFDPAAIARAAREARSPLEPTAIAAASPDSPRPRLGARASFLDVGDPGLVLVGWKRADDGRGSILRLLDVAGTTRTARIAAPGLAITAAERTSVLEDRRGALRVVAGRVEVPITPWQVVTLRLQSREAPPTP